MYHFRFDVAGEVTHKTERPGKDGKIFRSCGVGYGTGSVNFDFNGPGGEALYHLVPEPGEIVRVTGKVQQRVWQDGRASISYMPDKIASESTGAKPALAGK